MYEKLNTRGKKILFNSIIVFTIMLLVIGFYIGKDVEKKEAEKKAEEQKKAEQLQDEEGFTYSDQKETDLTVSDNPQHGDEEHLHGYYEYADDPAVDFNKDYKREVGILEDYFSPEEIKQAKEVARGFVSNYYAFNGENPLKHIEESKKFITESLYSELLNQLPRPSDQFYSKKANEIEIYEPYDPSDEYITLRARVTGQVYDVKGNLTKKEVADYNIILAPSGDVYKVVDYQYMDMNMK